MKKYKITQVRSAIGRPENQKRILKALGFRKLNQSIIKEDTPSNLGMIEKIKHLITLEEA